ncbi:MAG: protein translocase subunit SecD [Spirochaetia bacterium]
MERALRLFLVLAVVALSAWFLVPTVQWYFLTEKSKQDQINQPLDVIGEYARLSGNRDMGELLRLARTDAQQKLPENLAYFSELGKEAHKKMNKKYPAEDAWKIVDVLQYTTGANVVQTFAEKHYADPIIKAKENKNRALKLGLDLSGGLSVTLKADFSKLEQRIGEPPTEQERQDNLNSALEVLASRANQFGATEPSIRRLGTDQIIVDLPGEKDPEAVNRLVLGRGSLAFHIIDEDLTRQFEAYYAENPTTQIDKSGRIVGDSSILPAGYIVRGEYKKDSYGVDRFIRYYVLREQVGMDGVHIQQASTNYSDTNEPMVLFNLDPTGAAIFGKLTSANVNKPMAVLMDDKIKSVANIREAINNGQVSVTGFSIVEANNLATVLRTANLPIELDIINLQKIGPSLGEETIRTGVKAIVIGLIAVYIFTLFYYTGAGFIACFALSVNLLLTLGILSFLGFTLTLTSMAGLILNVGMAVDANVIIFERIRDELRKGKTRRNAIDGGFRKAFWTIMDANLTTFIAALFLSALGSGPVKGFAVTLAVGIASTLFTAIYVSRVLFDMGTEVFRRKTVSIGYGVSKT